MPASRVIQGSCQSCCMERLQEHFYLLVYITCYISSDKRVQCTRVDKHGTCCCGGWSSFYFSFAKTVNPGIGSWIVNRSSFCPCLARAIPCVVPFLPAAIALVAPYATVSVVKFPAPSAGYILDSSVMRPLTVLLPLIHIACRMLSRSFFVSIVGVVSV